MIFELYTDVTVNISVDKVLDALYQEITISDVFKNWPFEIEKEELIEEIKDEN